MNEKDIVLVMSGSRTFIEKPYYIETMRYMTKGIPKERIVIREGDAKGLDKFSEEYAKIMGYRVDKKPADWENLSVYPCVVKTRMNGSKYNALAGYIRNELMINQDDVNAVLLFQKNKSRGTEDALDLAKKFKKNFLRLNLDTMKFTVGLDGDIIADNINFKDFLNGGYENWREHVLKSL